MPVGPPVCLPPKTSTQAFCPFFNQVVWFSDIDLDAIDVVWALTPSAVVLFANISSRSVGCLFLLLMVSSAVQKLSSVIGEALSNLSLLFRTLTALPPPLGSQQRHIPHLRPLPSRGSPRLSCIPAHEKHRIACVRQERRFSRNAGAGDEAGQGKIF